MNEKIEQLAIKAGVYYHDDMYYDDHKSLQRFAELIVRECLSVAEAGNAVAVASVIREQFGVKE